MSNTSYVPFAVIHIAAVSRKLSGNTTLKLVLSLLLINFECMMSKYPQHYIYIVHIL